MTGLKDKVVGLKKDRYWFIGLNHSPNDYFSSAACGNIDSAN
jgi:hypothetical protein